MVSWFGEIPNQETPDIHDTVYRGILQIDYPAVLIS